MKLLEQSLLMILKLLLDTRIIWIIYIKASKNTRKKPKITILFDDMIVDMHSNKKSNEIVTKLIIRSRKLSISLTFITQSSFKVLKDVRLNTTHFFIQKIPNKRELKQIALNHSSNVDFKDSMNLYQKCTAKPYSFFSY